MLGHPQQSSPRHFVVRPHPLSSSLFRSIRQHRHQPTQFGGLPIMTTPLKPGHVITPDTASRADQLGYLYSEAKQRYEAAKAEFEEIKAGLKAEMFNSITDPSFHDATDETAIKTERPDIYAYYGKQTVAWELREGK